MGNVRMVAALVLLGLLVIFAVQNAVVVEVTFLLWSFALSRAVLIFIVLAVGVAVGWTLRSIARRRRSRAP